MAAGSSTSASPLPDELTVLARDVGVWDAEVEFRTAPGAAPLVSHGVLSNRLACGGRWLLADFRDEASGFEGHGIYGWDASRRAYAGTWVDNERSFLAVGEGTWDPGTQAMVYRWEAEVGGRRLRWREITDKSRKDILVFRSFLPAPAGGEFERMTVTYRRRP